MAIYVPCVRMLAVIRVQRATGVTRASLRTGDQRVTTRVVLAVKKRCVT